MKANELRRAYADFFVERGHTHVPSASLIPHDPTLLLTIAGSVPFKPYFLGEEPPPYPRAVTVQKCVRAGGKHNDLDEVGRTKRHLTFFEMLGNFSFGDYFKEQAIPWAWEFSTEVLGFDPDKLWATVHLRRRRGRRNLARCGRASPRTHPATRRGQLLAQWATRAPVDRVPNCSTTRVRSSGPGVVQPKAATSATSSTGTWYSCSSIRPPMARGSPSRALGSTPAPGSSGSSPSSRASSPYSRSTRWPRLVDTAAQLSGVPVGRSESSDISLRILAEHSRTTAFLISDGVFPSNEERGYVLRRIMRRAIRHAYLLGVNDIITPALIDEVVAVMGADYPDLVANHDYVRGVAGREEESFRQTLKTGSVILDEALEAVPADGRLDGTVAFQLHDTYGFPLEVTEEITRERGVEVDREGFDVEMAAQRARARDDAATRGGQATDLAGYQELLATRGETQFVGRDQFAVEAEVLAVGPEGVVLDRTPFYAESGGQVGDTGTLSRNGTEVVVNDTTEVLPGLHLHHLADGGAGIEVGQRVTAAIDVDRRDAIRRNHTATHILHWALREVLGDHVKQQGSMVAPDRLRFDFSHYEALTLAEIEAIEDLANREILNNGPVRHYETSQSEASALGAIAFFGDKYGDVVRVLEAGDNSIELCGGTHVGALGDIGTVKIVSEGSIGSNLRRIEAVTGTGALDLLRGAERSLAAAADALGVPVEDLLDGAQKRTAEIKELREEIKGLRQQAAAGQSGDLAATAVDGIVVARVDMDRDGLRDLAIAVRDTEGIMGVVLGGAPESGGAALVAAVTPDSGLHASELLADAAKAVKGGGGKNAELAMAGGKDPSRLDEALDLARQAAGIAT